ncbi:MAG: radical SAM protein [Clostridiaceae bacterium]
MKFCSLLRFSYFGLTTVLLKRKKPILGSIILTDKCNLSCRHCTVNNTTSEIYPHSQIRSDMLKLYDQGVRILLLYGGEPFLWKDNGLTLKDLVKEAKGIGYDIVNVVTNGTFKLDLPEADLVLVSLDGGREKQNQIRGDTYDKILENIKNAASGNICLYMAINQINLSDIEEVCDTAKQTRNVKAVSFNFHTPYPGTENLKLTVEQKQDCCNRISRLMDAGYPVFNLKSAFPYIVNNSFKTPCYQCVLIENGKQWICGRCIDIEGLCDECGFFFAAEYSLAFGGNIRVIAEMFRTITRFI